MTRTSLIVLGVLLVVSSAACGGHHQPSAADTATASLKAELLQQSTSKASPFSFSAAQADCTASRVVSAIGISGLQTYGLLSSTNEATTKTLDDTTLSTKDATSVVDAIIGCLGPPTVTQALRDAVSTNLKGTKTAAQRACLDSKLTIRALRPVLIDTLSGHQATAQAFYASLASCIPSK